MSVFCLGAWRKSKKRNVKQQVFADAKGRVCCRSSPLSASFVSLLVFREFCFEPKAWCVERGALEHPAVADSL
jgi:hypothetical protein